MRHDDPTINSILEADPLLNKLEGAWFGSLIDFFSEYENDQTPSALYSAARNVMKRKSEYVMAAAQTAMMFEEAFEYIHDGRICERDCCSAESRELDEPKAVYDPLGVMGADIVF